MTAGQLIQTLRARGYDVRVEDRRVVVRGKLPRDQSRAIETLRANRDDLLLLLETEAEPAVQTVFAVFPDAQLRAVHPKGTKP